MTLINIGHTKKRMKKMSMIRSKDMYNQFLTWNNENKDLCEKHKPLADAWILFRGIHHDNILLNNEIECLKLELKSYREKELKNGS
jgi:hypothetical protein